MALLDELRDAKESAKTHAAICQSLIKENKKYRAALEAIAAGNLGCIGCGHRSLEDSCDFMAIKAKEALEI